MFTCLPLFFKFAFIAFCMSDYIFVLSNQSSDLAGHFQKKKNYLKPCNNYWDSTRRSATNTLLQLSNKVKVHRGHKLKMTKFLRKYFTLPWHCIQSLFPEHLLHFFKKILLIITHLLILLSLKSNMDRDVMQEKLSPFKLLILLLPR